MDHSPLITLQDLQQMCEQSEQETLTLEFKACNELKVGTQLRDRKGETRARLKEDVWNDLTRDVTAFLNSAGGTLIYGVIQDEDSRAKQLDTMNAFSHDAAADGITHKVPPEKVTQWLRAHVQPPPFVNVYSVPTQSGPNSPWYLVLDIPQGEVAYMATDHKFYKRVGRTTQPMEQYEVVDVMNRTRAPALQLRIKATSMRPSKEKWVTLGVDIAVTSTNFVGSEFGQLKLTFPPPLQFHSTGYAGYYPEQLAPVLMSLGPGQDIPEARSILLRWGSNLNRVIFPGDWFNFDAKPFAIKLPDLSIIPNPTYLFGAELSTLNARTRTALYAVQFRPSSNEFDIRELDDNNHDELVSAYIDTLSHNAAIDSDSVKRQIEMARLALTRPGQPTETRPGATWERNK